MTITTSQRTLTVGPEDRAVSCRIPPERDLLLLRPPWRDSAASSYCYGPWPLGFEIIQGSGPFACLCRPLGGGNLWLLQALEKAEQNEFLETVQAGTEASASGWGWGIAPAPGRWHWRSSVATVPGLGGCWHWSVETGPEREPAGESGWT